MRLPGACFFFYPCLDGIGPAVPARRKCIYGALARYLRSMRRFSLFSCLIRMQYHKVGEGNMCFFTYCSESTDFYSRKAIVTFMFMGAVFFLFVSLSCTICTERVLRGGSVQSFSAPQFLHLISETSLVDFRLMNRGEKCPYLYKSIAHCRANRNKYVKNTGDMKN